MSILRFDCFSGISGDMILGSLLDLGLSLDDLRASLEKLNVRNYSIGARKVVKAGVAATKFDVAIGEEKSHRHLSHILGIIEGSSLASCVKERAVAIFRRLAEAEAKVHGTTPEKVHFHEVGAIDAIVDIVGACIGFELLGIESIHCSPLNVGSGTVESAHGILPVPAPGTAELLKGIPIYSNHVPGELVTPTGAAIVSTLADGFGALPGVTICGIGYGAGSKDFKGSANVLRVLRCEAAEAAKRESSLAATDRVVVLEASIDDMNPQIYSHLMDKLLSAGALDVFASPVQMKKNRPGTVLTVLAPPGLGDAMALLIFEETTTIGIRYRESERWVLDRQVEIIACEFGDIKVKVSRLGGRVVNFAPEYEDCRQAALARGLPYKWVQSRVVQLFMNRHSQEIAGPLSSIH
ncbi:MAG: nickel pincer cofactor biosynthesis protein LarC [Acidimicrobiia bacterium]|nr:nickel pincer cofactor biosynthesis protein LarC [Acidimicrobiia bacterium]